MKIHVKKAIFNDKHFTEWAILLASFLPGTTLSQGSWNKNNPQEACIQVAAVFLPVMSKILKKHAMRKMQVNNGL